MTHLSMVFPNRRWLAAMAFTVAGTASAQNERRPLVPFIPYSAPAPEDPAPKPAPKDPTKPDDGGFPQLPPGLPSLPAGSKWLEVVSTDPKAFCSEGTPYSYFFNAGDDDRLIIDFTGGGACANADSCDTTKSPTFFKDLNITRLLIAETTGLGIFAADKPGNPINGWTHFVIPNCTGDLNVGDRTVTYERADGSRFNINHNGAPNTRSALAWLKARYEGKGKEPRQVVVVGSSAGAYAAIVWTAAVKELFPNASLRQLADGGAGVGDDYTGAFPAAWNPTASYPSWVPGLNPDYDDVASLGINDLYKLQAAYYPDVEFAQYNYNRDGIQSFFLKAGGGDPALWTAGLYAKMQDLIDNLPNFHSYIAEGPEHAVLVIPEMYTTTANGKATTEWLSDYFEGKAPTNVAVPAFPIPPPKPKPAPVPAPVPVPAPIPVPPTVPAATPGT